jgi:hypothetical protein
LQHLLDTPNFRRLLLKVQPSANIGYEGCKSNAKKGVQNTMMCAGNHLDLLPFYNRPTSSYHSERAASEEKTAQFALLKLNEMPKNVLNALFINL